MRTVSTPRPNSICQAFCEPKLPLNLTSLHLPVQTDASPSIIEYTLLAALLVQISASSRIYHSIRIAIMASYIPNPDTPPRTSEGHHASPGLGINQENSPPTIRTEYDYDIQKGMTESPSKRPESASTTSESNMLSPVSASFPATSGLSPSQAFYTPQTAHVDGTFPNVDSSDAPNPFKFTTQPYTAGSLNAQSSKPELLGRRKGHKYRHSSIHASYMDTLVQPPSMRTPLTMPSALPIPTRKEAWRSLTPHQTARLGWCLCHFLIAAYIQFSSSGSLAMTALSRLLLFDAAGATICVVVDVMSNFEVWQRSSLKHPFGLERADVLAGFAMAVFIGFMGLDILSHGITHSLENLGSHVAHSSHTHERVGAAAVDLASVLAIGSTLVSALLLRNHARIGRAMRFELIAGWGAVLGNPSHFLTLSASVLLLIMPFLSLSTYKYFDLSFSVLIATLMIAFGIRLGTSLASMLLMSYQPTRDKNAVRELVNSIETDPGVAAVEEARFWQVHYGLGMANVKLRYWSADDAARVRQRVVSMVRQRLGGMRGLGWEVSVQMTAERG